MDMTEPAHTSLVASQFGRRAEAYVASAVHAHGEDLDQLVEIVAARRVARGLDLGCGGGHVSFRVAPHIDEVVAYDLSADMLAAVARHAAERGLGNIVTEQGDVEHLPFADGSFDLVLSRYSAHHWHDYRAALGEARRVLKGGGRAVFMDVVAPSDALLDTYLQSLELLRDPSHVRNYTTEEWRQALAAAGLMPTRSTSRRLRLDFASWIGRMQPPAAHVAAIRSLQALAPREVADHFAIEPDGSFTIDTATFEVETA
jgi:ubiquinone/menaquinone biosynthesis C-methylase UbiE